MRKFLILLILSFFSAQGLAAGCPDGSDPVKSISADGTYFVYNCGGGSTENSSSSSSSSNTKALAGIDIENDPNIDFFKPPLKPYPTDKLYWFGRYWQIVDFNKDGYSDVIYIGTMNPNNVEVTGEDTSGLCGSDVCKGYKPLPSLYLGGANKKLTYAPELIIDNREDSGMSLGRQILVADYNNDNILDFYVADHGIGGGGHNGVRDSYFLSQSNGTWVESSETHLSHSNFVVFDHGGATGDIDNDGDMDVVITELNGKTGTALWCLMNDGTGYLNKRKCGGIFSFALELADMDGDGYLDVLLGAHEFENNAFTGIVWNDGRGNFPKHIKTSLPQHKKKWGTVPEVSVADLDKDGDLDIVYSRAGKLYVGTAIQIIENLGNKRFKDHGIFPLVEAPDDYVPVHEGNEWNDYIEAIRFRDLDKDGDIDLYLSSGSQKTNGMVLLNQGDFNFSLIKAFEADELYEKLDDSSVIITKKVLTSLAKTKETENSIKFESSFKKNGKVIFEGVDQFTKFEFGLPLDNSGALLVGFKDLNVLDDYKLDVRLHIKYANIDFSTSICFQYHPGPEFMAARSRFKKNDWGGLEKIMPSSKCIGKWELKDNNKSKLQELGIYAVMEDIQNNAFQILEALDNNSTIDLSDMRSLKK
ncbi:VCBS repeat-containing protein [Candidatus Thioglobus sp.]|nr:VCBS repeat-containing protein [Candidatus Thioglobus sp.]